MKLAIVLLMLCSLALAAEPKAAPKVDYAGNLAKVPPTDPAPTAAPAVVPAMKGQHPRLLFTNDEIARTRELAKTDPILQKCSADVTAWAKRYKLNEKGQPKIVLDDTSALVTSTSQYMGLAFAYGLDHDPAVKKNITDILTMMLNQEHWADTEELDSNMGAGNNMLMSATLFDAVANELEPEFRKQMAAKLLTHARRMYYLGHKQLALKTIKYWQQDPANNHRWHRAAGTLACLLAVVDEPGIQAGYVLEQMKSEMDFLIKYYPSDGDCHEGSAYQQFGFMYLAIAAEMMDRVIGTEYLKAPGFANAWAQHVYYWAPGRQGEMSFGDSQNAPTANFGHLDAAFFISPKISRDKNVQAALLARYKSQSVRADGKPWNSPWSLLAFYDPTVGTGDINALPKYRVFADLGAVVLRDGWDAKSVAFSFKCGPYGGYRLNEYRHEHLENGKPHYINVAHDDPDANGFALGSDGELWFHPGVYATKKVTEDANTLTVDDKGQIGEGDAYTQPVKDVDMRTLSYLVGFKAGDAGRVIVEGEAGKAYTGLTGFRRTVVWMPGEYILLLDDVKASEPHEMVWRGGVENASIDDAPTGKCHIDTKSGKRMNFQVLADKPITVTTGAQQLKGRWGNVDLDQFRFAATSDAIKYAVMIDAWDKKPEFTINNEGGHTTLTVKTGDGQDVWTWAGPKDLETPSAIEGKRGGTTLIQLAAKDKAPRE